MSLKQFIQDRETPYSQIQNIVDNGDGTISYTESYNLNHPMCPIVPIDIQSQRLESVSLIHKKDKEYFEMLYGSISGEKIHEQPTQTTRSYCREDAKL